MSVMGKLLEEYEAVLRDLDNILMTESSEKLTIEPMHQISNFLFEEIRK